MLQVALEVLDILFSNKVLHQNENKSKRIRKQLQNQTVAVSVLGRHGVGKSTLLDSLLMERLAEERRRGRKEGWERVMNQVERGVLIAIAMQKEKAQGII